MEFWTYYRLLRRRLRTIAVALCVGLLVGVAAAWPRQKEYQATVTLTTAPPDESRFVLVLVTDQAQARPDTTKALAIDLIRSRTVAERVVQRLNLDRDPQNLRARLRVARGEGDLIHLSVVDRDPATAVLLANAYAEVAVAYNQEVNRREAGLAREFIERQLEATGQKLRQAENALDTFKRAQGIFSLSTQLNAAVARYLDLVSQQHSAELTEREITARSAALRVRLKEFSPTKTDQQLTENPVAQRLRGELVSLEVQLTLLRTTRTEEHPDVVALTRRSDALKQVLAREVEKVVSSEFVQVNPIYESVVRSLIDLETQRIAMQAKQVALGSIIASERGKLPALNTVEREFARLTRDVQIQETAYTGLQGRLNDIRIREQVAMNRNLVYIVDLAASAQPAKPDRLLARLLLAAMLGLSGGVGLVFFQHHIDDTLKTPKDAEQLLEMPVLSSIPKHNPPFDEAYRLLKTNLGLHNSSGNPKAIMFTSAKPGSGTSTVVFNLAQAIARGGKRVIVVDADLRQPAGYRLYGLSRQFGLEDVLMGTVKAQDALQVSAVENVWVLPAGTTASELADLLGSHEMAGLLEELKEHADVVLLDTPPLIPFAEGRALAPLVDGVVFVVAAGQVSRGVEKEAKRQLERAQARLLGVVVNKVLPEHDDSYHFYQKYEPRSPQKYEPRSPRKKGAPITPIVLLAAALVGSGAASGAVLAWHRAATAAWVDSGVRFVASIVARGF